MAGHAASLTGASALGWWLAAISLVGIGTWQARLPSTPAEYYLARCGHCHLPPTEAVCRYPREQRGGLVKVMLREQDAARVIDPQEALMLAEYLETDLPCP